MPPAAADPIIAGLDGLAIKTTLSLLIASHLLVPKAPLLYESTSAVFHTSGSFVGQPASAQSWAWHKVAW